MKYAYQVGIDNKVCLTSGENIIFWKEISEDEYNTSIAARHDKDQIIYVDSNGSLQARDKLTVWDEATSSWIPDVRAIQDKANNEVVNQARQAYNVGNLDRHQFSKLSHDQQIQLGIYLDTLLEIINIKESKDYDLVLPIKPDFLS